MRRAETFLPAAQAQAADRLGFSAHLRVRGSSATGVRGDCNRQRHPGTTAPRRRASSRHALSLALRARQHLRNVRSVPVSAPPHPERVDEDGKRYKAPQTTPPTTFQSRRHRRPLQLLMATRVRRDDCSRCTSTARTAQRCGLQDVVTQQHGDAEAVWNPTSGSRSISTRLQRCPKRRCSTTLQLQWSLHPQRRRGTPYKWTWLRR